MTRASEGERIARERIAREAEERTGFLDLGMLGLTELPAELFELKRLRGLNLGSYWRDSSGNYLEANANIGGNSVAASLGTLTRLPELRDLSVLGLDLDTLSSLAELKALESIDCSGTKVSDLAPLAGLQALQSIKCSETQVSELVPLAGLKALQRIDCSGTQVRDLAPLASLKALYSIDFFMTRVDDLAPLAGLKALQWIDCFGTRISDLAPLANLKALQSIDLFMTQVGDLAPLAGLKALQSINCFGTRISNLAPLASLPALQSINCAATHVTDLAPLANLKALQSIECSGTQVSDLVPLAGLQALEWIDCSGTRVKDLAPLAQIASLRQIRANGLTLVASSTACIDLPALETFHCFETRLRGLPVEVLSQNPRDDCLARLRAHFSDLAESSVESRDVKLMVLGNGRVGKTQLCRRLRSLSYDPGLPSTHGIVVESFDLPRCDKQDFAKVHIWDFGGQDTYHGTHALFLRANAVFVLVWASEFESGEQAHAGLPFRNYPLRYWVDYVRQLGGKDAAVLVVQTRCDNQRDRRACPVGDNDLRQAFGSGYCEVLQFSALNDRGLPALQEKLGEAIAFLRESQGVARIGASRQRVKARLEKLRAKDAKLAPERRRRRWLTQDDFRRICAEERLVSEPHFLLDYLHNAGVVFHREGMFEDRIVLDQSWALDAIYVVFKRDSSFHRLRELRGRFTRPLLEAFVWAGRPVGEQKLLIGMMESCGICFKVRDGDEAAGIEAEYIAPDLLPARAVIQTELAALWDREGRVETATYGYDLLLPSLLRALTSRIGRQAGVSALYWRDGLCVYEASTGARALIEQAMDAGWSGRLVVSTRGGRARELLERLQNWLENEQGRMGLKPRDSPEKRSAETTRRERADGEAEEAPKLQLGAEPRTKPRWYVSYAWNDPTDPERERNVDRTCAAAEARGAPIIRDKTAMAVGDSISKFMKEIGRGDRVFVFLSDKYLKSPFCMFELFEIWRNSRQDEVEFKQRTRLYALPDAKIFSIRDRVEIAKHWRKSHDDLVPDAALLAEKDFKAFRLMQDFAHHVGDILALFADTLLPRTFDDFLKYGFDDPPQP